VDSKKNFYFLEMNTRLQVEHPVTEYITGLDLVEEMIKIAAGQPFDLNQETIPLKGWAMEARVYAEDPLRNFLPSIGHLEQYVEPSCKDGTVRVDSGVREGDEISVYYDPLISKLVTYGNNRMEAIARMGKALDDYVIRGVNHNVCFIRSMMEHPKYQSGDITTKFIPQEFPKGFQGHELTTVQEQQLTISSVIIHFERIRHQTSLSGQLSSFKIPTRMELLVEIGSSQHRVIVEKKGNGLTVEIGTKSFDIPHYQWSMGAPSFTLEIENKEVTVQLFKATPGKYKIQHIGSLFDVTIRTPREAELASFMPTKKAADTSKLLASPMPGRIVKTYVKAGDRVTVGQPLIVVEAMKMQNVLRAERDSVIKKVQVNAGDDVAVDQELILFE